MSGLRAGTPQRPPRRRASGALCSLRVCRGLCRAASPSRAAKIPVSRSRGGQGQTLGKNPDGKERWFPRVAGRSCGLVARVRCYVSAVSMS